MFLSDFHDKQCIYSYLMFYFTFISAILNCNFEEDLCQWIQSNNDQFDWTRKMGSTQSSNTGPSQSLTKGMIQLHFSR